MPIPFLGFGAVIGVFFALNIRGEFFHLYRKVAFYFAMIISLVLLSNWINHQSLSYEEVKRLAALVCSYLYFVFFHQLSFSKGKFSPKVKTLLLVLVVGELLASIVFWELPQSIFFSSYSWFKFAGSYPLIMLFLIVFASSRIGHRAGMNLAFGLLLFVLTYGQGAKSTALLALLVCLLRYRSLSTNGREQLKNSKSQRRSRLGLVIFIPVFLVLYIFQRLVELGLFGSKLQETATQYGDSLLSSLILARPEIPFSLQVVQQMPFIGFGTLQDPLNHLHLEILSSSVMSYGSQKFLLHRIFDEGFNLHSWGFDLLARGGFLMAIPLFSYLALLFRNTINSKLLVEYPSLYFVNLTCIQDFFFSPYSWFVTIQVAFSIYAYFIFQTGLKNDQK